MKNIKTIKDMYVIVLFCYQAHPALESYDFVLICDVILLFPTAFFTLHVFFDDDSPDNIGWFYIIF